MLGNRKRILLVEDDPEFRNLVLAFLPVEVYEVIEAESAAVAVEKLSTEMPFDLAIIDFWLGTGHAVSIMDKMGSNSQDTPIVMISGGNGKMDLEATAAIADISGATVFLQKPFQRATLLAAMANALRR